MEFSHFFKAPERELDWGPHPAVKHHGAHFVVPLKGLPWETRSRSRTPGRAHPAALPRRVADLRLLRGTSRGAKNRRTALVQPRQAAQISGFV